MTTYARRDAERDGERGEGSLCFRLTKPVVLHELDEEVTAEMGWRKPAGLVTEGDPLNASEENYVSVWVLRPDVDANAVKRAVTAHQGVKAAEAASDVLTGLREQVAQGQPLSESDLQTAVRLLLTREN